MKNLICLICLLCALPASAVVLEWDRNREPEVAGYTVYYGVNSRDYLVSTNVGNNTLCTITNLLPGVTYFFAVTAYAFDGLESEFSEEVSYTVPLPPPSNVALTGLTNGVGVRVAWSAVPIAGVSGYAVKWGPAAGNYTNSLITTNLSLNVTNLAKYGKFFFVVTTRGQGAVESAPSPANVWLAKPPAPAVLRVKFAIQSSPYPTGPWSSLSNMVMIAEVKEGESQFYRIIGGIEP